MKPLYRLLFILLPFGLFGQLSEVDSLTRLLPQSNDTTRFSVLMKLSDELVYKNLDRALVYTDEALNLAGSLGDDQRKIDALYKQSYLLNTNRRFKEAIPVTQIGIELAKKISDRVQYAKGLLDIAYSYNGLNELSKAIDFTNQALEIYMAINRRKDISRCYSSLGMIYQQMSDYDKSLDYLFKSLKIKEELDDRLGISILTANIGNSYLLMNKHKDAERYFRRCLKIDTENNDQEGIIVSLLNLGVVYERSGEPDIAIDHYEKSLEMAQKTGDHLSEGILLGNIGTCLRGKGQLDSSLVYLQKALEIKKILNDPGSSAHTCNSIYEVYRDMGNYTEARKYTLMAIEYAEGTDRSRLQTAYKNLAEIDFQLGDFKNAYGFLETSQTMKDSIFTLESEAMVNELEMKYETEKKEQQITLLTRQKETAEFRRNTYVAAGLLFCTLLFILYYQQQLKSKRNRQLYEKEQEIDQMKSRFFTNISHEFRTPLTLILGPIAGLLDHTNDLQTKKQLEVMQRNGDHLLQLINQLLDLSKLESGKLTLEVVRTDVIKIIKGVLLSFHSIAEQKDIHLEMQIELKELVIGIDPSKFEAILINLLSNAIKFTPSGGEVKLLLDNERRPGNPEAYFTVEISNSGPGIQTADLQHVFDRFYQGNHHAMQGKGTGIGLALVKELVELHQGTISVESTEGKGARFTIRLPIKLATDDLPVENVSNSGTLPPTILSDEISVEANKIDDDKPLLLIIEDHRDIYNYIYEILHTDYSLLYAEDGEKGVEMALEYVPDLIVSDLMMPKKNGYEVCDFLKSHKLTSHVPFILLTARAGVEARIKGLKAEADDYLTKPFLPKELQLRIRNIITARQRLQQKYKREGRLQPAEITSNSIDQQFLENIVKLVEEHMPDEKFGVEHMGNFIGMSRSQLHRKLKALTGEGPNQLIRSYRLTRAHDLLQQKAATTSEIAYRVGFSSPSYFSKCFLEQYGYTPSNLLKSGQ